MLRRPRYSAGLVTVLLLGCLACSGPTFTSRPILERTDGFVRLDTYRDPSDVATVVHDHPAEMALIDLQGILQGVQVQEQSGLLEAPKHPRPVFRREEVLALARDLREGLRRARSSEWVAFALMRPAGANTEVTSGALFVKSQYLHVILANDRTPVAADSPALAAVRRNPVRPLRSHGGALTFSVSSAIIASGTSWLGGSAGPSASELVIDPSRFHESSRAPAPATGPPVATELQQLKDQVTRLEAEVARLRRQLESQARELTRLRARPGSDSTPSPR